MPGLFAPQLEPYQQALAAQWQRQAAAYAWLKAAGDAENSAALAGRLIISRSGWALLEVPNGVVRGLFQALDEPGAELPVSTHGPLNAHISVMTKGDVDRLGGPDKLTERGKLFHYQLGPIQTVVPKGWDGVSRVWFVKVHSPELQQLRRTYGLTPKPHDGDFDFHITFAIRRTGVLGTNPVRKGGVA